MGSRFAGLFYAAALSIVGCKGQSTPAYDGRSDARLLRRTYTVAKPDQIPLMASDGHAIHAAYRIFTHLRFEGMTRESVLGLLGDPRTISDYSRREEHGQDDRLTYRFDSGYGGWEFTLHFENGVVHSVERTPLE